MTRPISVMTAMWRERPASHASRHLGAGGDTGLAFLGLPLAGEG